MAWGAGFEQKGCMKYIRRRFPFVLVLYRQDEQGDFLKTYLVQR